MKTTIPDGEDMEATHSCELDFPDILKEGHIGYIICKFKHFLLISIGQLTKVGCQAVFDNN